VLGADLRGDGRDVVGLAHGRAVVADALDEARDHVAGRRGRRLVRRGLGRLAGGHVAQRRAHPAEDLLTRPAHATNP
jgi:hypothetical protein